ncbi:LPS export ABC transporter periplasmic protein LptC [Ahniella affigens]|nr:LPS export ABC transporter periplasmic protein LptC [Ahniella affigens]
MSRGQGLMFILLLIGAVITSYWVWFRPEPVLPDAFVGPPRSDYELGQFDMQVFDDNGKLSYYVEAPRLSRDAQRESFTIDRPRVRLYDQREQNWLITAKSGYIDVKADRIDFDQNVVMQRDSNVDPMRFKSDQITAFHKEGRVETATPIEIKARGATLTGTGLKANLNDKTYVIEKDFHATMPPARSR